MLPKLRAEALEHSVMCQNNSVYKLHLILMFRFGVLVTFVCVIRAADQPSICFRNVAKESGIGFVLDNGATPEKRMIETMAGGLAIFDSNNDGRPDMALDQRWGQSKL